MSAREPTDSPVQLLRDHLRADSLVRERSISLFVMIAALISVPFTVGLAKHLSYAIAQPLVGVLLGLAGYEAVLLWLFRRGWYHPVVAWANVLIEVSLPFAVIALLAVLREPDFYAGSSLHVVWTALICFTALRANPVLSLAAGLWAGLIYCVFYGWAVLPLLPESSRTTLLWPFILFRGVFLVMAGVGAGTVARHFIRKAEDALRAVREQDLMGKYLLHERIGAGGMAEVYRATYCPQGGFQKAVAIKRVLPRLSTNPDFTTLFLEEAALCSLLAHPNIVQVFDCGRFQGTFILAMEYVEGAPLHRLLRRGEGRLPVSAVTYLGAELAAGLDYLHRRTTVEGQPLNLVHRDVNPPNVLVSRLGEVKLADFGVARAATRVKANQQGFFGKTLYAAPEQLRSNTFDGRADLFALGLTLHEALTGEPVLTTGMEAQLRRGELPPIPAPSRKRPDVPPTLDALILRLLAADPTRRPPSGAEVRRHLTELTGEAAPYPGGQKALAAAVELLRTRPPPEAAPVAATDLGTTTHLATGARPSEPPLQETQALRGRR